MAGVGRIAALWGKFMSENVLNQIPGKLDQEVLAIYHNYESDASGPYSVTLCAKVKPGTPVPAGMESLSIPEQNYTRFTSRKGEMPGVVIEVWGHVWELTQKSELKRSFTYDFEVYDHRAADPQASVVDVCIAL